MYGDPDNTGVVSGDDRPLPDELRGRVDMWRLEIIEKEGGEGLKRRVDKYSTFNALIRAELHKGNL